MLDTLQNKAGRKSTFKLLESTARLGDYKLGGYTMTLQSRSKSLLMGSVGIVAATTMLASSGMAFASPRAKWVHFVERTSKESFTATVANLKKAVSANGMMVMGTLNQASVLTTTGLHLKGAESFFIGNPTVGKKLFQMDPAAGAVVPLRIYVWVNATGKTQIGYYQPSQLLNDVDPKLGMAGQMLNKAFALMTEAATK